MLSSFRHDWRLLKASLREEGVLRCGQRVARSLWQRCGQAIGGWWHRSIAPEIRAAIDDPLEYLSCEEAQEFPVSALERTLEQSSLPAWVPGHCNICGSQRGFRLGSSNWREDFVCLSCGQWGRKRQLAAVLGHELGHDWHQPPRTSLNAGRKQVWLMETGRFADCLATPQLTASEYLSPTHSSGATYEGVRHEDAMAPSFGDESLDIVLSTDVFEHIPDPYRAHEQVFRCLRPGGFHAFTVPYSHDQTADDVRARIVNGETIYYGEKIFHGDPLRVEGVLVYTLFGREMQVKLK